MFHLLRSVVGVPEAGDGGQQTEQNSCTDLLVLTVQRTQVPVDRTVAYKKNTNLTLLNGFILKRRQDIILCGRIIVLRQRTEQGIKFLRRERVLGGKLLQQDEILAGKQIRMFKNTTSTATQRPAQRVPPTMFRCRALLKSICSSSSSSLRRTSCGLKSRPGTSRTEPHAHRSSRTARRATSCWARCSSASRLFAPDGGQIDS